MNEHEHTQIPMAFPASGSGAGPREDFGPRIFYRGKVVITTERLANAYGVSAKNIHDNYQNHTDRFDEGYHLIKLSGSELRAFKNHPDNVGVVAARTASLILWTEAGALRHAKLLDSPEAWEVFSKLEDAYFIVKLGSASALPPARPADPILAARENRLLMRHSLGLLKMAGVEGPRALIAANTAVMSQTGYDTLTALGIGSMADPVKDLTVIPKEIGMKLGGLSSARVNVLLEQAGYQVQERDHKNRSKWALTEKGRAAGADYDVRARNNETGTAQQILWPLSIVDALRNLLKGGAA